MKGKDISAELRLAIALECARYSDPINGNFIARGRAAVKRKFLNVHIDTIKNIHRQTKAVDLANPELLAIAIAGNRKGRCARPTLLTDELKGNFKAASLIIIICILN